MLDDVESPARLALVPPEIGVVELGDRGPGRRQREREDVLGDVRELRVREAALADGGGFGKARKALIAGTVPLIASRITEGIPAAFSGPPRGGEPWQPEQNVS